MKASKRYFVFKDDKILVPFPSELDGLKVVTRVQFDDCYAIEVEAIPEGLEFSNFRALLGHIDEQTFALAGRAYQILNWDKRSQYCGSCGTKTKLVENELAKVCSVCGNVIYPRISPAVIVAILREDKLLLAHAAHFAENWYSLIAGFVEPGETFEECVHREIAEEVGIKVKNLQYFGSQPWPFPDSLMVGFIAEYDSGEIQVDGSEITSAGWYSSTNLPDVPSQASIAGKIITWFVKKEDK